MKSSEKHLRYIIREMFNRESVKLANGKIVETGSKRHINEIDKILSELDVLRKQLTTKALRKERYTISRAIESIRSIRRKAEKTGINKGLLDELDR